MIYIVLLATLILELLFVHLSSDVIKIRIHKKSLGSSQDFLAHLFLTFDILFMIFVMGLRGPMIGTDTPSYLKFFHILGNTQFSEIYYVSKSLSLEYGFGLLNKVVYAVTNNQSCFLLVCAFLIYWNLKSFVQMNSTDCLFSLLIFICWGYYNTSFNVMRQFIAICILLNAFKYIESHQLKYFIISVIVASAFHVSAAIFIIVYPVYQLKIVSKAKMVFIGIVFGVMIPLIMYAIPLIVEKLNVFNVYLSREGIGSVLFLIECLILFCYIIFYNQFKQYDGRIDFWIFISMLSIIFNACGLKMDLFIRLSYYFASFYMISVPSFINSFKNKSTQNIIKIVVIGLFSAFYLHSILTSTMAKTNPYEPFWM